MPIRIDCLVSASTIAAVDYTDLMKTAEAPKKVETDLLRAIEIFERHNSQAALMRAYTRMSVVQNKLGNADLESNYREKAVLAGDIDGNEAMRSLGNSRQIPKIVLRFVKESNFGVAEIDNPVYVKSQGQQ